MAENRNIEDGLVIGLDASRNRSGGAKAHLIGVLTESDPLKYGIKEVHVWAYKSLLEMLPARSWLIKHCPPELEQSIFRQVWWQRYRFPGELHEAGCSLVLNTDAGTVSNFRPSVTMSRDMLSYEPGEIERYGFSKARLRLILLRFMQNRSLRGCDGAIFLTEYAAGVIQQSCGKLPYVECIPHGVGGNFKDISVRRSWPQTGERPIRCLYISNAAIYKHQWVVVRAVESLRKRGHEITLTLVGGGAGKAQQMLDDQLDASDPKRHFVKQLDFLPQSELPEQLASADLFIFASSCENMPNTLVEAMAVGLPIACSDRGPMPEVLADGGAFFDPENADSISAALEQIITDNLFRETITSRAKALSEQYSWLRCGSETWSFVFDTYKRIAL